MSKAIQAAGEWFDLLTEHECRSIAGQVRALRAHWRARSKKAPFYTLGAASYLDAMPPAHDSRYKAMAQQDNPILQANFEPLYKRLAQVLEARLEEPVVYDPALGLPGFHVFLADAAWAKKVASIHIDRQYQNIDWSAYELEGVLDERRQLSMTLTIDLPAAGAGLRLWEIDRYQVVAMNRTERQALRAKHQEPHFLPYRRGRLVVHSGHQLHQIAPMPDMAADEQRLTLQAHALPTPAGWVVYW